jgi:CRISPR-associated exonuclease Cas4
MESYIQISKINDFLFCPRSVYLKSIYDSFQKKAYQSHYQTAGTLAHEPVDTGRYSSQKRYIQALEVYSDVYGIAGKIDILDTETNTLIERKNKVSAIYDGYKYQLYAQMVCLREMGYVVDKLCIHSLSDNKRYEIEMPTSEEFARFEEVINRMKYFSSADAQVLVDSKKCITCIYKPLCHKDETV